MTLTKSTALAALLTGALAAPSFAVTAAECVAAGGTITDAGCELTPEQAIAAGLVEDDDDDDGGLIFTGAAGGGGIGTVAAIVGGLLVFGLAGAGGGSSDGS